MEPEIEGRLVSDHRIWSHRLYKQIGLTFVGLCFVVGAVYTGYMYYAAPIMAEEKAAAASDHLLSELIANAGPFTFTIVPNAAETLSVPELAPQPVDALKAEFAVVRASLPSRSETEIENILDVPVGEMTFLEYLNGMPREMQDPFMQMQGEIDQLVVQLNQKFEQKTLAERIGEANVLLYPEASKFKGVTSVYPSQRVAEAYFVGQALAAQFPSQAQFYTDFINEYIKNGIAYGHYTDLDATVSKMLVDDYVKSAIVTEQGKLVLQSLE